MATETGYSFLQFVPDRNYRAWEKKLNLTSMPKNNAPVLFKHILINFLLLLMFVIVTLTDL